MACRLAGAKPLSESMLDFFFVNQTTGNKFQRNLNQNSYIFIQENAFENVWKMAAILSRTQCVNLLWLSDAIWWHRSGSQVMACCLMAASHNLSQCWMEFLGNPCKDAISMNICKLLLGKIAWESFIFNRNCQDYVLIKFPMGQWVNSLWPSDTIWWHRSGCPSCYSVRWARKLYFFKLLLIP